MVVSEVLGLLLAVLWGTHCARNQTQAPACKAHALPTELSLGPLLERGFILGRTEELLPDSVLLAMIRKPCSARI